MISIKYDDVLIMMMQMVELLKEYMDSGDLNEAMRCLKELDVPHFHHELVYQVYCYRLVLH